MPQIVLQPCSDPQAQANLRKTILQRVSSVDILEHATDMESVFRNYFKDHPSVTIWGVKVKKGRPQTQWQRMKKGDLVLFYAAGSFVVVGTVDFKLTSPGLADYLWHEEGVPPEFSYKLLYVVKNVVPLYTDTSDGLAGGISSKHLFDKAQIDGEGLRHDGVVMGITVVSEDASKKLISNSPVLQSYMRDFSGKRSTPVDFTDPKLSDQLESVLSTSLLEAGDVLRLSKYRIEQGKLRAKMLNGRELVCCSICGQEFPATSITTAHIKKRSKCTSSEMRDVNVVAPMCYLGCDHLFENGYIIVDGSGKIRINRKALGKGIQERLESLDGLDCLDVTDKNAKYYAWHRDFHSLSGA